MAKMMRKMMSMKKSKMMRRMAKKKSIFGKKASVFHGNRVKTVGGLKKADLFKNKHGKIVSKKQSTNGTKLLKKWCNAVVAARKKLGIKGFLPVGGATPAGKALLASARSFYKR